MLYISRPSNSPYYDIYDLIAYDSAMHVYASSHPLPNCEGLWTCATPNGHFMERGAAPCLTQSCSMSCWAKHRPISHETNHIHSFVTRRHVPTSTLDYFGIPPLYLRHQTVSTCGAWSCSMESKC